MNDDSSSRYNNDEEDDEMDFEIPQMLLVSLQELLEIAQDMKQSEVEVGNVYIHNIFHDFLNV